MKFYPSGYLWGTRNALVRLLAQSQETCLTVEKTAPASKMLWVERLFPELHPIIKPDSRKTFSPWEAVTKTRHSE